jgi:NTP pyrophosphatase (non-canonical NTP hydrolase)
MNLKRIQELVFKEYCLNGYTEMWNKAEKIGDIAEMGLVVTEVSEALEELRSKNTNNEHLAEECADIVIRVMNHLSRKGLDLEKAILQKHDKNLEREHLHGKSV